MRNRKKGCRVYGCSEEVYLGGLCRKHVKEERLEAQRETAAMRALESLTIGGRLPDDLTLREELAQLREWWDRASIVVQTKREDELMPADEAKYALQWCIALAKEIVDAELALRDGRAVSASLGATRAWVWERFRNLTAGLRSNGLPRTVGSQDIV